MMYADMTQAFDQTGYDCYNGWGKRHSLTRTSSGHYIRAALASYRDGMINPWTDPWTSMKAYKVPSTFPRGSGMSGGYESPHATHGSFELLVMTMCPLNNLYPCSLLERYFEAMLQLRRCCMSVTFTFYWKGLIGRYYILNAAHIYNPGFNNYHPSRRTCPRAVH